MSTIAQIKADLQSKVGIAVENVKREAVRIIMNEVEKFYGEYDPSWYQRTYQMQKAVERMVNSAVKVYGIGASFHIYVDASMFNHKRGTWSEWDILYSVMEGATHGGAASGTPVWTESMKVLDLDMKNIIKEKLIAAGIPVH